MTIKRIEPRTLRGFHDRLPHEALPKELLSEKLRVVFRSFGFLPIETPHLEYLETLLGGADEGEVAKQIFHFKDQGDRDVGLRFDLTVPLARLISQYRNQLSLPFKRYAIGNVFRGERPQAGRYREFTQCDFDTLGTVAPSSDAEILNLVMEGLGSLGVSNYMIRVNHRGLMNGIAEAFGFTNIPEFLRIVDKLDKIGVEEVKKELLQQFSVLETSAIECLDLLATQRSSEESIALIHKKFPDSELIQSSLHNLSSIIEVIGKNEHIVIDLSIARGLGYYTGMVYETFLTDKPELGSVSSGGRYDNLASTFTTEAIPGVGGSIGLDRLFVFLSTRQEIVEKKILMIFEPHNTAPVLFNIAKELRGAGVVVEVYPSAEKMKKQFEYSEKRKHSHLLFTAADGALRLRDASSRAEVLGSIQEILALLKG